MLIIACPYSSFFYNLSPSTLVFGMAITVLKLDSKTLFECKLDESIIGAPKYEIIVGCDSNIGYFSIALPFTDCS